MARCKIQVPGEGPRHARIMIVGEAPGKNEVLQKRPFVGRAGRFLNKILASVKIERSACYITNVVKFRPTKTVRIARSDGRGERVKLQDRCPTPREIEAYLPLLKREILRVKPKIIVMLGRVATAALLDTKEKMENLHGRCITNSSVATRPRHITFVPTYHPAVAIRNRKFRARFVGDMKKVGKITFSE